MSCLSNCDVDLSDGSQSRFQTELDVDRHSRTALLALLEYEVGRRHPGRQLKIVGFDIQPV